jgi:hypothetical protein
MAPGQQCLGDGWHWLGAVSRRPGLDGGKTCIVPDGEQGKNAEKGVKILNAVRLQLQVLCPAAAGDPNHPILC